MKTEPFVLEAGLSSGESRKSLAKKTNPLRELNFVCFRSVQSKLQPLCRKQKNQAKRPGFLSVLEAGLEPARANAHKILSLACLPIPPLEQN